MTLVTNQVLYKRNLLLIVFVAVFVINAIVVSVSIFILRPPKGRSDYSSAKNVLFIVVDDLRPTLRCYGDQRAITPNIDQLASKSVLFKNAYAQQALCAPSRTSLLTSRRPDTLHLYDTGSYWRETVGNFTTLPQHFKNHGYETISIGKIFHHGKVSNKTDDYPYSWSKFPYRPSTEEQKMKPVCPSPDGGRHMNLICPVDVETQPEGTLPDIQSVEYAIEYLQNKTKESEKTPFFLGVGFYKPHIPFKFPRDYLNLYPIESMDLALNHTKPEKMPDIAWNPWTDIRLRDDVKKLKVDFPFGPLPVEFQKLARQGYYASVSYMDDLLGRLLETLETTGLAKNTIVVLLGDHGWSLGEHQEWSKYSNFEVSVNVPLVVHVPGLTEGHDDRTPFKRTNVLDFVVNKNKTCPFYAPKYTSQDIVELVDIFPTLAEVSNLPVPPLCKMNMTVFCSEGLSFYPVLWHLQFDKAEMDFSWKLGAFSQYPRPSPKPEENSDQPPLKDIHFMGFSIRTQYFRYTEWVKFNSQKFQPYWAVIVARELYDHTSDPLETNNICDDELYSNIVIELSRRVRRGWRFELPPGQFDSPKYHKLF